jgi:lipoyl synthase
MAAFMAGLIQLGNRRREPKPAWLKVRMPGGGRYEQVRRTLRELNLATVCEEASCPNMGECWGSGTATVMLMGEICTRGCRFCDVASGMPGPLDPLEPRHLAEAVGRLGLDYLVVTSVNRDELPDGGAAHFAQAIVELRRAAPRTLVEVLTPDFQGSREALQMIIDAAPTVAAHNLETVERLSPRVRDRRAAYRQSLEVLRFYKSGGMRTKSSLMLGLGEKRDELLQAMRDLRAVAATSSRSANICDLPRSTCPSKSSFPRKCSRSWSRKAARSASSSSPRGRWCGRATRRESSS